MLTQKKKQTNKKHLYKRVKESMYLKQKSIHGIYKDVDCLVSVFQYSSTATPTRYISDEVK